MQCAVGVGPVAGRKAALAMDRPNTGNLHGRSNLLVLTDGRDACRPHVCVKVHESWDAFFAYFQALDAAQSDASPPHSNENGSGHSSSHAPPETASSTSTSSAHATASTGIRHSPVQRRRLVAYTVYGTSYYGAPGRAAPHLVSLFVMLFIVVS